MQNDTPLIALLRKIHTTNQKLYLADLDDDEVRAFDIATSRLDADGHPDPLVRTGLVGTPIGNVALPDPKNTLPLHLTPRGRAVLADALYGDAEPNPFALDKTGLEILSALAKKPIRAFLLVELEGELHCDGQTARARIPELLREGLIHRPNGKRGGVAITSKGAKVIAPHLHTS